MNKLRLIPFLALTMLFAPACSTILPGNDPIVVRGEQTRGIALSTFDVFLKFEKSNREILFAQNPAIKKYADYVRTNEKLWLDSLDNAIQTYKSNRNEDNRATLVTWIAVLERALADSQAFFVQSQRSL